MSVTFYWESLGQKYEFDPAKRYLIYFRGCFAPPTGAHYNTISDFTHLPNTKFFIHQGGNERRHGVPFELSRKIWRIYIKELMPADRTVLLKRTSDQVFDMVEHEYTQEADVIVFIAGNENYYPPTAENHDRRYKYREIFNALVSEGKEVILLYLDRPEGGVSATKFVEALKNNNTKDYGYFRLYLPEKLSDKGVRYIVKKLKQCHLK